MPVSRHAILNSEMTRQINVALIEDNTRLRRSLEMLIDGSPGFRCTGGWPSVEEALRAPKLGLTEVLLLDLHLPGIDGDEGIELLLERVPGLQVVMFTVHDDDQRVFNSLCRGACGYLLKNTSPARLLEAIRETRDGGSPMSPSIARKVVRLFRETTPVIEEENPLTVREKELVSLLAEGHSYQSSAASLGITVNTIRNHIRSIYEKLQVHSQSEAVSKALRAGLI